MELSSVVLIFLQLQVIDCKFLNDMISEGLTTIYCNTGVILFLAGTDQFCLRDDMSLHGCLNGDFARLV